MSAKVLPIALMGEEILHQKAKDVQDIHHPDIQKLIQDMLVTMHDKKAAGIAAPQVFKPLRIIIFRVPSQTTNPKYQLTPHHDPEGVPDTILINPSFEPLSDKRYCDWEGCLSIPGLLGRVERYYSIVYRGTLPTGKTLEREAHGFHARVFQHEYDHIEGRLYPYHIKELKGNFGYREAFFPITG